MFADVVGSVGWNSGIARRSFRTEIPRHQRREPAGEGDHPDGRRQQGEREPGAMRPLARGKHEKGDREGYPPKEKEREPVLDTLSKCGGVPPHRNAR